MSSLVWMCTPCERSTSTRVDGGKTRGGGTGAEEGDAVGLTDDACQSTGEPPPILVGTMAAELAESQLDIFQSHQVQVLMRL
jgi:hypothetical protein